MTSIKNIFSNLLSSFSHGKNGNKNILLKPKNNAKQSSLTRLINDEFVFQDAIHANEAPSLKHKKDYLRFLMRLH